MLDHVTLAVSDFMVATSFYDSALKSLGIGCLHTEGDRFAGYGAGNGAFFWIGVRHAVETPMHVAFIAQNRQAVDAFHAAAVAAGGRDNGMPGVRPCYHPDYYGAFVLDPDGHNIEAVCRKRVSHD